MSEVLGTLKEEAPQVPHVYKFKAAAAKWTELVKRVEQQNLLRPAEARIESRDFQVAAWNYVKANLTKHIQDVLASATAELEEKGEPVYERQPQYKTTTQQYQQHIQEAMERSKIDHPEQSYSERFKAAVEQWQTIKRSLRDVKRTPQTSVHDSYQVSLFVPVVSHMFLIYGRNL